MRERQVGRRLWRRRKRRGSDPVGSGEESTAADQDHLDPDDGDGDGDGDDDGDTGNAFNNSPALRSHRDLSPPASPSGTRAAPKRGFLARLFGRKEKAPPPAYLVEDPVREILLIPRGARRLDAFEQRLTSLEGGSVPHRDVALAFYQELLDLAAAAGVDLSLYETRVVACAKALILAGEDEKAGGLYARIGRRHQAAELFVAAGAIDALEEAHAELSFEEGGTRLEARLAFERFEALFLVGMRDDAIASLERAVALWEQPAYLEVLDAVRARLPRGHGVALTQGDRVLLVRTRFPLVLGRGEDSAVRIDSPLVSRTHVDIQRRGGELVLRDLVSSGGTRVDDVVIAGPTPLSTGGSIDLAGVVVDYEVDNARLCLWPRLRPNLITVVPRQPVVDDVIGCDLSWEGGVIRLEADSRALLNNDQVRKATRLLLGDRLLVNGVTWVVTG